MGRPDDHDDFSLAWWQLDPERWELLRFEGIRHKAGYTDDRWGKDREHVLEALITTPGPADHDFALFLLDQEVQRHKNNWGFHPCIEIAAILVAEHRNVEDVFPLWAAVTRSFDTMVGIPHRLLFAGGARRTLEHVDDPNLLKYLQNLPLPTDEEVTALLAERRRHYADIFGELLGAGTDAR